MLTNELNRRIITGLVSRLKRVAGVAPILYDLKALFTADNQSYSNSQSVNTPAEGVTDGSFDAVVVDGTIGIVSNKMAFTAQTTPAWTDLGIIGEARTKSLGMALFGTINLSTWEECGIAWHTAAALIDPDSTPFAIQADTTDGSLSVGGGPVIATGLSLSTDYGIAIVLGCFNSNGVPYKSGDTAANFLYGALYYLEIAGTWNLIWTNSSDNTATLYPTFANMDAVGTLDNLLIPDYDFSAVLQPTVLDTFTDDDGTSLDAHTMDVGDGWTESIGSWEIQSNAVIQTDDSTGHKIAFTTGIADFIGNIEVTTATSISATRFVFRGTDSSNYWCAQLHTTSNTITIREYNTASFTDRASASVDYAPSTTYKITAIAYGTTIFAFSDGANKISYASASFNETAVLCGIGEYRNTIDYDADNAYDNFSIRPRTSATYESTFAAGTDSIY